MIVRFGSDVAVCEGGLDIPNTEKRREEKEEEELLVVSCSIT